MDHQSSLVRRTLLIKPSDLFIATVIFVIGVVMFAPHLIPVSIIGWAAAVTIVSRSNRFSLTANRWIYEYSLTGVTTNTLDTPVNFGKKIKTFVEPSPISGVAYSNVNGKNRITFTSTGAFTAVGVLVYVG